MHCHESTLARFGYNSSSTDKRTGHRSSRVKSTFRHLSITRQAIVVTPPPKPRGQIRDAPVSHISRRSGHCSVLAHALLWFPRVIRKAQHTRSVERRAVAVRLTPLHARPEWAMVTADIAEHMASLLRSGSLPVQVSDDCHRERIGCVA